MISTEIYMTRRDGVVLVRTYSDAGFYIARDGVQYEEAIDPEGSGRVYTETDIPIPQPEPDPEEEMADYAEAGRILLGEEE